MAATSSRTSASDAAWEAAVDLAAAVSNGAALPELASPVLLEPGEVLHASVDATAWRFQALDVAYERQRLLAVGGPLVLGLTAAASAAANRRARADAERLAAPQWRPLGLVPILATSHRMLVQRAGAWGSVWYGAIRQLRPALPDHLLELYFEDDPPYALEGPSVPYLAVVLATVLADRLGSDAVRSALVPA
jgi:hypothetical protein